MPKTSKGVNLLEFVNAVHSLRLLLAVHKTAKGLLEVLPTRSRCHSSETRAVPVDLSSLWIECTLLPSFFFQRGWIMRRRLAAKWRWTSTFRYTSSEIADLNRRAWGCCGSLHFLQFLPFGGEGLEGVDGSVGV